MQYHTGGARYRVRRVGGARNGVPGCTGIAAAARAAAASASPTPAAPEPAAADNGAHEAPAALPPPQNAITGRSLFFF